jgi:hypothetical protein
MTGQPERHVVDFGSDTFAVPVLIGVLSSLGHPATRSGSRVIISDDALSGLSTLPYGNDGAIIGYRDGATKGVRIGGYAYTLWPESAGPKLATRWALR